MGLYADCDQRDRSPKAAMDLRCGRPSDRRLNRLRPSGSFGGDLGHLRIVMSDIVKMHMDHSAVGRGTIKLSRFSQARFGIDLLVSGRCGFRRLEFERPVQVEPPPTRCGRDGGIVRTDELAVHPQTPRPQSTDQRRIVTACRPAAGAVSICCSIHDRLRSEPVSERSNTPTTRQGQCRTARDAQIQVFPAGTMCQTCR